jgi:hypothetical protein
MKWVAKHEFSIDFASVEMSIEFDVAIRSAFMLSSFPIQTSNDSLGSPSYKRRLKKENIPSLEIFQKTGIR